MQMVSNGPMCEAFRANIGPLGTTYRSRIEELKLPGENAKWPHGQSFSFWPHGWSFHSELFISL